MVNQSELSENIIQIYQKHARAWTELRGEFLYEKAWLDRFLALKNRLICHVHNTYAKNI